MTTVETTAALLEGTDIVKHFPIRRGVLRRTVGHVRAVDGVNLAVEPGKTVGLVGESGSGKSTVGRVLLRLLDPTSGTITFDGTDITALPQRRMRALRRGMQLVFQDPFSSFDPLATIADSLAEPMRNYLDLDKQAREERVCDLLRTVSLDPEHRNRYPREFSGGQLQRIAIARALALSPKMLVLDEPVSSLDVSIQADIINLLGDLQDELGLAYLFIAHDLALVRHVSDHIAVMYLGRIVEQGPGRRGLRTTEAPVHRGAAVGDPGAEPGAPARARAHRAAGRHPVAGGATAGMPVPHAVPVRVRAVPDRRPAGVHDARRHDRRVPPAHRWPRARGHDGVGSG